jgi:DNA-binding transcriptional ArsR family regulator
MIAIEALGTPRRREILRLVWQEERSAGAVHRALGDVTFGAVSQHLRILTDAGLLHRREAGRQRFYRAHREALGPLQQWLEAMWDDALYRLKVKAELEQARRGPLPQNRRRSR